MEAAQIARSNDMLLVTTIVAFRALENSNCAKDEDW
jgi:hypothetical protein